jgi:hypothetical protein
MFLEHLAMKPGRIRIEIFFGGGRLVDMDDVFLGMEFWLYKF